MTNFSANFLTNCSFGEQFANLNELYIWYARTEQLWYNPAALMQLHSKTNKRRVSNKRRGYLSQMY